MADAYKFDYAHTQIGKSLAVHADCFEWLSRVPENSLHSIVTDPPYGVKEFEDVELQKRSDGKGGIWRLPPAFDGNVRSPLPRFTALTTKERVSVRTFFVEWSKLATKALRPGAHVFLASNAFLSQMVFSALVEGGLEFRGELIRLVRTMRGGDRPKNAEEEFPNVSSLPRGCYEPWGVFRKPLPNGMKVSDCLREYQTGGLRRQANGLPFNDVIESERTPKSEKIISDHPSLKPQSLMLKIVHAALPLGVGVVVDPFMGGGSTIAACVNLGIEGIGVERQRSYYDLSVKAIPRLALLNPSPAELLPLAFTD